MMFKLNNTRCWYRGIEMIFQWLQSPYKRPALFLSSAYPAHCLLFFLTYGWNQWRVAGKSGAPVPVNTKQRVKQRIFSAGVCWNNIRTSEFSLRLSVLSRTPISTLGFLENLHEPYKPALTSTNPKNPKHGFVNAVDWDCGIRHLQRIHVWCGRIMCALEYVPLFSDSIKRRFTASFRL